MEPIRSGRTPLVLRPDRVLTKWSMSTMQASSSQHLAARDVGRSTGKFAESSDGWLVILV